MHLYTKYKQKLQNGVERKFFSHRWEFFYLYMGVVQEMSGGLNGNG